MTEKTIQFEDFAGFFARHIRLYAVTVALGAVLAMTAVIALPKKYKSEAIISIKASYFKNPLVSDLVSEIEDSGEANAERESLIRAALDDDFIDDLGERYGIYKHKRGETTRVLEREYFRKNVLFYPIGSSMYRIEVIAKGRSLSNALSKAVVHRIISVLNKERFKKLSSAKDAIENHAKSLGMSLRDIGNPAASKNPIMLESELKKTKADIEALLTRYTKQHPEVVKLIKRSKSLEKTLNRVNKDPSKKESLTPLTLLSSAAKDSLGEVYSDLITKLSYLSIILEIEKDSSKAAHVSLIKKPSIPGIPVSPKPLLVMALGILGGLLLATILSVYLELRVKEEKALEALPEKLNMPLLGVLPPLGSHREVLYLEAPETGGGAGSRRRAAI